MDVLSKSYKKTPISKYGKRTSKTQANRRFRRMDSEEDFPSKKRNAYRNITNRWDINNVTYYWSKKQAVRDYNKNYNKHEWFKEIYPILDDYLQYWERCVYRK